MFYLFENYLFETTWKPVENVNYRELVWLCFFVETTSIHASATIKSQSKQIQMSKVYNIQK